MRRLFKPLEPMEMAADQLAWTRRAILEAESTLELAQAEVAYLRARERRLESFLKAEAQRAELSPRPQQA